jgi:hypothetical protein
MEIIMTTVPQLSTTIKSQNLQLQRTTDDNTDLCRVTSESISTIQLQHSSTENRIEQIQKILYQIIHTNTPSSSGRNRKKSRSTSQSQANLFANASDGDLQGILS